MSILLFQAFRAVEDAIYDNFAGPNDVGLFSASVQQTVYDTQVSHEFSVPNSRIHVHGFMQFLTFHGIMFHCTSKS